MELQPLLTQLDVARGKARLKLPLLVDNLSCSVTVPTPNIPPTPQPHPNKANFYHFWGLFNSKSLVVTPNL